MPKTRVYELAKELEVQPKELLEMLKSIGVSGKVPSSSIEATAAQALRQMVENKNNPPEATAAPAPAPIKPKSFKKFSIGDFRKRSTGALAPGAAAPSTPAASAPREEKSGPPTTAVEPSVPLPTQPMAAPPAREAANGAARPAAAAPRPATPQPAPPRPVAAPAATVAKTATTNGAARPVTSAPAASAPVASAAAAPAAPMAKPAAPVAPSAPAAPRSTPATDTDIDYTSPEAREALRAKETAAAPASANPPAKSRPAPSGRFARARSIGRGNRGGGRGRRGGRYSREASDAPRFGDKDFVPEAPKKKIVSRKDGEKPVLTLPTSVTVAELAEMIEQTPATLIKELFSMSIIRSANQPIEADVAGQLLSRFGYGMEVEQSRQETTFFGEEEGDLVDVPPVVTVMGHVDHGKTSLLDIIRSANVQSGEAGGITQRIGAYETEHNGQTIVFLDTPGHEAFTRMRARGAHITDIAVLVVAADDGVMPQTREAVDHARAAKVPIIVAMNKMDRAEADPNRVKGQLAELELVPEDYGGDTVVIPVSAVTGMGVQDLLDMILLVTEMQEMKANPDGPAVGTIIEARQDTQKGPVATVLLHKGTLCQGDYVVVGDVHGRVRTMVDYKGEELDEAGPKRPVSITGLSAVPHASDTLQTVESSREARETAAAFAEEAKEGRFVGTGRVSLNELFARIQQGDVKELDVVVKADGQGSMEALCQSLEKQKHDEVRVKIISRGVGNVTESDVMLASASDAIIIGFAVEVDNVAASLADREGVEVRTYQVIYDAINDVHDALEGMLAPIFEERVAGEAEVRALFKSSRAGTIAGCMVTSGKFLGNSRLRVLRGPKRELIHEGKLDSLRHIKAQVKEVTAGSECGIAAQGFNDFQEGDILQSIVQEQIKRKL